MTSAIVDAFARIRRDTPERPVIFLPTTDAVVTADQLWRAAESLARRLIESRTDPDRVIVAALGNRVPFLATMLACRMRNTPLCPVDSSAAAAEVERIAIQLDAGAVLTWANDDVAIAVRKRHAGGSPVHAALLKLTSGSSGTPRATLTSEDAIVSDSTTLIAAMGIGADDVQIAGIPLSHAYAIGNLVGPLFLQGTPMVLRETFVPHRLPDDARRYGAAIFPGVPFMFDHFATNPPEGGWPPSLRNLISAGAPLEVAVAERFRRQHGIKIHPFYGSSETGGITFDAGDGPASDGFVGTPLPGVTVTLVPYEGAPDGGGRILVKGPAVIRGYAGGVDPEAFQDGGFLTGDLGTFTAGALTLAGRVSSFVNVAGRKVQPDEVERVLREFDGVTDVRVVGISDARRGEQLVAAIVAARRPSVLALRQFCAVRMAAYKIPRAFVFLDAIPLTERGKTDRGRLRDALDAALSGETGML